MTNRYFYLHNGESVGPFSIEALKEKNISKETKVWCSGMSDWVSAGELDEIKYIFEQREETFSNNLYETPPPPPDKDYKETENKDRSYAYPPKTYLLESILVTLFCCLPIGIVGILYSIRVEESFYSGKQEASLLASRNAGKWVKIGFIVGIIAYLLAILFPILMMVGLISMTSVEALWDI